MPKNQLVKGRYFITLPKTLVKAKKWDKGTELIAMFNERGNVEFYRIERDLYLLIPLGLGPVDSCFLSVE